MKLFLFFLPLFLFAACSHDAPRASCADHMVTSLGFTPYTGGQLDCQTQLVRYVYQDREYFAILSPCIDADYRPYIFNCGGEYIEYQRESNHVYQHITGEKLIGYK